MPAVPRALTEVGRAPAGRLAVRPCRPRGGARRALGLAVALLPLVAAACSEAEQPVVRAATPPAVVSAPAAQPPAPEPSFTHVPPVARLTGEVGVSDGPALAVKVDNTRPAFPQVGLQAADVVYVEEVEGGLTRLLAVFSSELPPTVGPVRSARLSDIEILAAYGPVALAYSGANPGTERLLADSPLRRLSMDGGVPGYRREGRRPTPYDVLADPRAMLSAAPDTPPPADVGFRFDAAVPPGGRPAAGVRASWSGASIDFAWSAEEGRYLQSMDGRASSAGEGGRLGAATVVVQQVPVEESPFRDVTGAPTPHVRTIGSGAATVLRDGYAWDVTWSRPDAGSPTTFALPDGSPLPFKPGQTWVVLVPAGAAPPVR